MNLPVRQNRWGVEGMTKAAFRAGPGVVIVVAMMKALLLADHDNQVIEVGTMRALFLLAERVGQDIDEGMIKAFFPGDRGDRGIDIGMTQVSAPGAFGSTRFKTTMKSASNRLDRTNPRGGGWPEIQAKGAQEV
jgi:hypothetical protein